MTKADISNAVDGDQVSILALHSQQRNWSLQVLANVEVLLQVGLVLHLQAEGVLVVLNVQAGSPSCGIPFHWPPLWWNSQSPQ